MGRIHPYGEPKTEDSPITEFFAWLIMVGLGFPMAYGWIFVSWGWISNATLFELSAVLGIVAGLKAAITTARHTKKMKDAAFTPLLHKEVGRVAPPNPALKYAHPQERFANARSSGERGYGR